MQFQELPNSGAMKSLINDKESNPRHVTLEAELWYEMHGNQTYNLVRRRQSCHQKHCIWIFENLCDALFK
jgi:hypothetical protein